MAATTTTVAAITNMVRRRVEAVPLDTIVGQHTLHYVQQFVEQLATFAIHFATTKWGGKHGFLPLVLSKSKMIPATMNNNLDYERLKKPELLNQKIEDSTQGLELLQLQADYKGNWQEYTFQEVFDSVAVEAIFAAIDAQYVEELKKDNVG